MTAVGQDTLKTRRSLEAAGQTVSYYSLEAAAGRIGDVSRLPYSMKVLLENLLRFEDGVTVTVDDIQALADWQKDRRSNRDMQYRPARVLPQDFTGVPCVVDLAAMRDAIRQIGRAQRRGRGCHYFRNEEAADTVKKKEQQHH